MPKKISETEFAIFSAALLLLEHLDNQDSEHFHSAQKKLVQLCCPGKLEGNEQEANNKVNQLIEKFRRKSSKRYGEEGFDLRVISESLRDETAQRSYLLHSRKFTYLNQRQLINIVTKVINHFQLEELAALFREKYFSEVDCIAVTQFLDPEYKKSEPHFPATRYPSLLTTMHNTKKEQDTPQPSEKLFHTKKGFRLVPKNKMNPRLPLLLSEISEETPAELKYHIGEEERLITEGEIIGTELTLRKNKSKHASLVPGPLYLSSFPVVSSINKNADKTETVDDLVSKGVCSVLTIEANNVPQRIYNEEKKALPSDWIQRGVSVALIQCPDLHAMRIFHTLLAAQYLFSEVLGCLPGRKNSECKNLINKLMGKKFEKTDVTLAINEKSKLKVVYDNVISFFASSKEHDEAKYCRSFISQCQSDKQTDSSGSASEQNQGRVLVHCKAGMSRSATALLSMYIIFIDVILRWYAKDFIQSAQDETFFGAIIKAIYHPSKNPIEDVNNIAHIFSKNYRHITPLNEQILVLAQLIEYKRQMLKTSDFHYDGVLLKDEAQETRILSPVLS